MTYTVRQLSERTGLSVYTIRYYAREGLLLDVPRSASGARRFEERHLMLLDMVECLKACGMTIGEIGEFIRWTDEGDGTLPRRLELITQQEVRLRERMEALQQAADMLRYKRWMYTVAEKAGTMAVFDTMSDGDVPDDILAVQKRLVRQGHAAAAVPERRG